MISVKFYRILPERRSTVARKERSVLRDPERFKRFISSFPVADPASSNIKMESIILNSILKVIFGVDDPGQLSLF